MGIRCIVGSLAVVAVVAAGLCEAAAQLVKRYRWRDEDRRNRDEERCRDEAFARIQAANETPRERDRVPRREAAQLRHARVETKANCDELEQALIKLCSPEVQALYDDEVLERLVGLR